MQSIAKVVWSEGMYLGPHHFQAQGRYFEEHIGFAASTLWSHPYGLLGCRLNAAALEDNILSLAHARGIFPDGLPFWIPECDAPPPERNIADVFPRDRDIAEVLLAIESRKAGGINCAVPGDSAAPASPHVRYIAEERVVTDENNGRDEKPVTVGRKNLRLILDNEAAEGAATLAVARILRDGSGRLKFDETFIPQSLRIGASERLSLILRRLIEILEEKAATLVNPGPGKIASGFSGRDIVNIWMLHTVDSSLGPLRHLALSKQAHPEKLFVEMSRLAGALCTFALESHPRTLPLYDHANPSRCFDELDRHIREHLDLMVPTNCLTIDLKAAEPSFYDARINDPRCAGPARWVLGVRSPSGDARVMSGVPRLIKICSSPFVRKLVERGLPGLNLNYLSVPPAAVTPRPEFHYFSVDRSGPCWDHIVKTG
nr:type VI secretion system baseplate subunit TssK [Acidobacteriota bacterium]